MAKSARLSRTSVDGVVAVVTGASSGIGAALSRLLAARVSELHIIARRADRLEALAATLRAQHSALIVVVHPTDLSDPTAVAGLIERLPSVVGLLVNCAGLGDINLFEFTDVQKLQRMVAVNVAAVVSLTHAVIPGMVARGCGGVLNISSGFGLTTMPGVATYAGTKHFVSAFSQSLRMEMVGTGVTITQVCPGPVATNFEKVAGNPTGMSVPNFVEISAEQCAQSALDAYCRGRALVIPGRVSSVLVGVGRWMPDWVLRLVYGRFAPALRRFGPPNT